ncbi:MAG: 5-methyltetrahydrofolate--homocysteine methyltransferase [Planctomycetota bacterium]|nr:5-methyltetrahydrofolate--homocysteine methyltransferase [Planctomycetota bacterium]GIK53657.1 MAG: 5-methyltetrahydrofolate--homocysteine methyltransferase [Planctomycetota bacterium]
MNNLKKRLFDAMAARPLIIDGAMGTELQARGLPAGGLPESFVLEHADKLRGIHEEYFAAGADIVLTNTFGATRFRLEEYPGMKERVAEINEKAVAIARAATHGDPHKFVAGDIGPSGLVLEPMGEAKFEYVYELFREQARALAKAGPDLIVIETIMDIRELKAAIIATREVYAGPIFASMFYQEGARTMTGTDPLTHVTVALACGADGIGANCSMGPEGLLPVLAQMAENTSAPLLVEPNAGLPQLVQGKTVFPGSPEYMAEYAVEFAKLGVNIIGGCCGTNPRHIRAIADAVRKTPVAAPRKEPDESRLASRWQTVRIGSEHPVAVVGERINPTNRKKLAASIKSFDPGVITKDAESQVAAGALILDCNVGVPMIDEPAAMKWAVRTLQGAIKCPLSIDSPNVKALELGLIECEGRPLINSITAEEGRLDPVPVIARYGGAVIALLVDDDGIPADVAGRRHVLRKILECTDQHGMARRDVYIDCLTLPVSAEPRQCINTLRAILELKQEFGVRSVLGVSNISFGMPMREMLTGHFLSMALAYGLDLPIINPLSDEMRRAVDSANLLLARDRQGMTFTTRYAAIEKEEKAAEAAPSRSAGRKTPKDSVPAQAGASVDVMRDAEQLIGVPLPKGATAAHKGPPPLNRKGELAGKGSPPYVETGDKLGNEIAAAIIDGDDASVPGLCEIALKTGLTPLDVNNKFLIAGMGEVGRRFALREYFLPQVMRSANAMKAAFGVLKAEMQRRAQGKAEKPRGTVVIATVKGDVHDIGKNIVIAVLENYGYRMVDLGKNVPTEAIVKAAVENKADIVGLSALMTTTMTRMPEVIKALREAGWNGPVVIGGAVTSVEYAREINAAAHAEDAIAAVKVANDLLEKFKVGA